MNDFFVNEEIKKFIFKYNIFMTKDIYIYNKQDVLYIFKKI